MGIREVLFATDFSASAEGAGRVAGELVRQGGGRLHVVHVVPPVTDPSVGAGRLAAVGAALREGLAVETALLSGRPAREIVAYARRRGVDIIVIGTHGRTGVSRAILGSVAESVVRLAPCLVLTVPPGVAEGPRAGAVAEAVEAAHGRRCVVCAREEEDLICEPCRARIRGEALERKLDDERAGRRGSPA